ncbi:MULTISPECIES: glutathione peroxidase [Metabacillus]|uniref:Glutathione peroxidase n=2 Tax=Metabacillus TaxID=2675233 RepID=A0A179SWS7_9BACI|nr:MULTISPECIES: glutathione peroxidase [Metabacillus]OAS86085.1 glutathione peroxidase [Metabacillus litoralis]QNF30580.1 glutathione peroxidase [Metabacillus sp. KUDC1714]
MSIYDFEVETIKGDKKTLKQYENKVLLIVNTASNCGFTPQYKELQALYEEYGDQGFTVLGFPCNQFMGQEPGSNSDIENFCEMNYGVSFPMYSKIDVNGENAHPLFVYLASNAPGLLGSKAIKWNFTKFLVNNKGVVIKRFSPNTNPSEIKPDIKDLLKEVRV